MSRRSSGEGSITQRKDSRWQASLMVGGVRKTVYGKTRQEAHRKLCDLQRQASSTGALPSPGTKTVDMLLDEWLDTVSPNLKATTVSHYRLLCNTYISPALGRVKLSDLRPDRIQRLYANLQSQGHDRTARLVHCLLHQACELAVLWGWLSENPTGKTVPPSYRAKRRQMWQPEELRVFWDGTQGHWLAPLWVVALTSGCRHGELLALHWQDVDWERAELHITKTLQRVDGHYVLGSPKTRSSHRTVMLPLVGMEALEEQGVQQAEWRTEAGDSWHDSDLVFTGETGRPLHRSVVAHALERECQRLGIQKMTPHGLRHMHASLLLAEGLPIPAVSARLGHAHAGVTLSVYAHIIGNQDTTAASAIGRALPGYTKQLLEECESRTVDGLAHEARPRTH